jgi:hypothetical protein
MLRPKAQIDALGFSALAVSAPTGLRMCRARATGEEARCRTLSCDPGVWPGSRPASANRIWWLESNQPTQLSMVRADASRGGTWGECDVGNVSKALTAAARVYCVGTPLRGRQIGQIASSRASLPQIIREAGPVGRRGPQGRSIRPSPGPLATGPGHSRPRPGGPRARGSFGAVLRRCWQLTAATRACAWSAATARPTVR